MYIVSPLSQCASIEKRDRFLEYIARIAPVTLSKEPNCFGYGWFRSAEDNDVVPSHWLRGFEIYKNADANQIEHRASDEYKAFRKAVGEEGLLARPSDLRFWHPTGIGFLTKEPQALFLAKSKEISPQYLVTDEFRCQPAEKGAILEQLKSIATVAEGSDGVLTFWVLDRVGAAGISSAEDDTNSLYILVRCRDKSTCDSFCAGSTLSAWEYIGQHCTERRRTTWFEAGIGFFGR